MKAELHWDLVHIGTCKIPDSLADKPMKEWGQVDLRFDPTPEALAHEWDAEMIQMLNGRIVLEQTLIRVIFR